jgi:integrase
LLLTVAALGGEQDRTGSRGIETGFTGYEVARNHHGRSPGQILTLAQATIPARYGLMVLLGGGTGLRQGEALGLTLDRIDAVSGMLRVDQQVIIVNRRPALAPPKTVASVREVPVPGSSWRLSSGT